MPDPNRPAIPTIDVELRTAVRKVMDSSSVTAEDVARVQEILDRKASQIRAPFIEKVRRFKAAS